MEKILVQAEARAERGKGSARSLRRAGSVPAVMYSGGNSTPIAINTKEMSKLIVTGAAAHSLITIAKDGAEYPVLVKDYQRDPVSEELLHVDFFEVSMKDMITITVPVNITKNPIGVKMGGVLQQKMRDIKVECLPGSIPESIDVDAGSVEVGQSFLISDLPAIEGVTYMARESAVVLSVNAPKGITAAEEEEEAAAAAEPTEPEVIGKGKESEEAE